MNKQRTTLTLMAVVDGDIIPIEQIEDIVFSQKMIGDGFGMIPTGKIIYSPVSGIITEVAGTKHAYYIEMDNGYKVLIHIGENTLLLNGKGFKTVVERSQTIQAGDQLGEIDLEFLTREGYDTTISVIVLFDDAIQLDVTPYVQIQATGKETTACRVQYQQISDLSE